MRYCSIEECGKPRHGHDRYCAMHRWRITKYGNPDYCNVEWHGKSRTLDYEIWRNMIARCYKVSSKGYSDYGGRGIKVCERWRHSYSNFIADMGNRPTDKYQIDRIDNEGNYEPLNCRWATTHQQAANRRRKSNHVGVFFTNQYQQWEAQLKIEGKFVLRKKFQTEEEALRARQEAEIKYLGGTL